MARIDKKFVRVVAIVLTVAMLMTTCLVQAFAYPSSISTTFYNQPIYAETYYQHDNSVFRGTTTYGVVAGITMVTYGLFFGDVEIEPRQNSQRKEVAWYEAYTYVGSDHYQYPYALEGYTYHQVTYDGVTWGANNSKRTEAA